MNANEAWIAILQRIPTDLHDALALGITTGAEIVVQRIVKLEPDFMMIRGRLAGTQDSGRVVFIPYSQLTFIAVQRAMTDPEVDAVFGQDGATVFVDRSPADGAAAEAPPEAEVTTVNEPASAVKKPAALSKSTLLAKVRDRLKDPGSARK